MSEKHAALHKSTAGKWVPCTATQRACPRASHVEITGDQQAAADFLNAVGSQAAPVRSMSLTATTVRVLDTLVAAGLRPYVVGGSVRDAVLGGATPKDVDIEVYGGAVSEVARALRPLGRVDEVGKSFGVLKLTLAGEDFDISLPRKDSKTGAGHRDFSVEVDPNLSLAEASARRDYTINALMYSHASDRIVDLHGGLADLQAGYLRHVSDAFDEDPLRVLRGVQLAARFNMRLHPMTITKAASLRDKYDTLAAERVQMEFQKLYEKGTALPRALEALRATGWDHLLPGLAAADQQVLDTRIASAQRLLESGALPREKRALILGATIASALAEEERANFLWYTSIDGQTRSGAKTLTLLRAPAPTAQAVRQWAHDMPRQLTVRDWWLYQRALGDTRGEAVFDAAGEAGVLDRAEADLLSGFDLINAFPTRKAGPWRGVALAKVRSAQYAGEFNTRAGAVAWLDQHAAELG